MSGNSYLQTTDLPFCKGCGHSIAAGNIETALEGMKDLDPLDIVMVSDIGCIGIIDRQFATHTVHGLHGRSVALATGIALGLRGKGKKIIVLLGDGGATIGLQHLLDAAHRNLPMTVIVHNNMLYGMTGGQPSSLTPCGYRTSILPEGKPDSGIDLCSLVRAAGAPLAMRLLASGDFSSELRKAFEYDGFSYIELLELCTSHGTKFNPGKTLRKLAEDAGLYLGEYSSKDVVAREPTAREQPVREMIPALTEDSGVSLFDSCPPVESWHDPAGAGTSGLEAPRVRTSVVLSGSAGEGIQTAAELLAKAAMSCGLHVSKKGSYPVTVGIGFSQAEVLFSSDPIRYTGAASPDYIVVTSSEGLGKVAGQISGMRSGMVLADAGLALPPTTAEVVLFPYREKAGAKNAVLLALIDLLRRERALPPGALRDAMLMVKGHPIDPATLEKMLES